MNYRASELLSLWQFGCYGNHCYGDIGCYGYYSLRAKVFQVMKCSQCKRGLTLPAIHFLCQHSYHQNCVDDEYENECPICARENRTVLDIIQRQEHSNNLHEVFHGQLTRAVDGFSVVADYFGKDVFGKNQPKTSK
jgi:hypothetical protein